MLLRALVYLSDEGCALWDRSDYARHALEIKPKGHLQSTERYPVPNEARHTQDGPINDEERDVQGQARLGNTFPDTHGLPRQCTTLFLLRGKLCRVRMAPCIKEML